MIRYSVAVLADESPSWRPDHYGEAVWNCLATIRFPVVKLSDYRARWAQLEASANPFAIVVMVHLKTQETQGNPVDRYRWKWAFTRRLYKLGLARDDIIQLYRVIAWLMRLPEELERQHWQAIVTYEKEQTVYALCEECIAALTAAVELCQGSFLAGFSLPDAAEFELWQSTEAASVQRELSTALEQLAHVHAHAGRHHYAQAIEYAQRWLALDSLREPAHRALMRFYAWSGDRTAAQQQYQECVRILATELGIAPDPETTALYGQIRAGNFIEPTPAPSAALAHNLPLQPTPFVGRTHVLAQIAAHLADPECRLLTVVRPGGAGKTRLAIEAARAQVGGFAHGVWFVDLAPITTADLAPGIILRVLDAPDREANDARRQLLSYLRDKEMLLVLDNCEHLVDTADLWVEALHTAPGLKLLLTSRARLNLRQEWLLPLAGLIRPRCRNCSNLPTKPRYPRASPLPGRVGDV